MPAPWWNIRTSSGSDLSLFQWNREQQAPVWTLSQFFTSYCNTMWFTKCAWQILGCFSSVYFHFLCSVHWESLWIIHVYGILRRQSVKSSFWEGVIDWSQQHMCVWTFETPISFSYGAAPGCFCNSLCQTVDLYISDWDWLHWFPAIRWFDVAYKRNN